jgi:TnpA family transposase
VDGLIHHETDLEIAERHSDTGAFTGRIFVIRELLGLRLRFLGAVPRPV